VFGHFPELIIVIVIALIVFGPEKLPETAANVGKMVREFRSIVDTAMNPVEEQIPDDFSSYYYESLARAGEEVPDADADVSPPYHNYYELDEDTEAGSAHGRPATSRRMVTRVVQPRSRPPA
jgi:TatA/E family protein of Tat protein translocase